jgi:predicted ATPase
LSVTPPFLQRLSLKESAALTDAFPTNLPFVPSLDIRFTTAVTFFVGENGSGKSTVLEAIATLCGLPATGGGRNELADLRAPGSHGELSAFVRGAFRQRPRDGYFFRAEFQANFASVLEEREADPDFDRDPYARYGGRSLHTRSHGEAFLQVFSAWLNPGMILMDEPEAALSPQRQLVLLSKIAKLAGTAEVQFIIATHSPILLTFPSARLLSFDGSQITPIRLEDTSHFQITKGILDSPGRYWKHLVDGADGGDDDEAG